MTKFLTWLKSLFIHSSEEKTEMTDQVVDVAPVTQTVATEPAAPVATAVAETITPAAEVKTGVADFEQALAFVEQGVSRLGSAAKDELVELAKKYL